MNGIRVAYFNSSTGLVYSILSGPSLEGMPLAEPGSLAVLTDYTGSLPAIWDGEKVVDLPPKPSPHHEWTLDGWKTTLPIAKEAKWQSVKEIRNSKEFGPFVYNGLAFDGDIDAQRRISLAVMGAQAALITGQPWGIDWTLADNSAVTLSASEMVSVAQALGDNIAAAHEEARLKRAAIEAATTVEELENI